MKITLEIPDGTICAFFDSVVNTDTGLMMFSHQIGSDNLKDGNTIKLPRESQEKETEEMTNEEAIKTIEIAIAEVEWDYPMNYSVAFEMAIKALKNQEKFPCNVGDIVYEIAYPTTGNIEKIKHEKPIIQEHVVSAISKNTRGFRVETTFVSQFGYDSNAWFYWDDNYLYKTKEEAQNKIDEWLKRQKKGGEW